MPRDITRVTRRERRPVRQTPAPSVVRTPPTRDMSDLLLDLQRTAGNQAVNSLLRGWRSTGTPIVQRAPDPREEAIKEANAVLQESAGLVDEDEKPATTDTMPRPGFPTISEKDMCGGQKCFTDKEIYGPVDEANKRMDKEMEEWRALAKIPYKDRLYKARSAASVMTQQEDFRKLTAEEVWDAGFKYSTFFFEHEKDVVYADQNEMRRKNNERIHEESEQIKNKAQSDQYQQWVAQGEQNSSPAGILQPFAFEALSPLVGAAYLGVQSGKLLGDTYNDCVKGGGGDCTTDLFELALAVAMAKAIPGKGEDPSSSGEDIRGVRDQEGNITIRGEPGASKAPDASAGPTIDRTTLSANASALDPADASGQWTKAGRALQKHANRPGSAFPKVKGRPEAWNKAGQEVVDTIVRNPASTVTTGHLSRFGDVIEIKEPSGRGVRYAKDGTLIGFLEP